MSNRLTRSTILAGGIAVPDGTLKLQGAAVTAKAADLNTVLPGSTDGLSRLYVARATYDFAVHGGAVGAITIGLNAAGSAQANVTLPDNAIVLDGLIYASTAVTSGGAATISVGVNSANDLLAATAKTSFGLQGVLDIVPVGSAATAVRVHPAASVTITVATAALTAGKFTVFLRYLL